MKIHYLVFTCYNENNPRWGANNIINPIQIITDGILQRNVDFNFKPRIKGVRLNHRKLPEVKKEQIHNIKKVVNSGDVLTIKGKSPLAKALVAYHNTPYGHDLVRPWIWSKAMVRRPFKKPQIMKVMLFANGIFTDKLAPVNFFMWMITNFHVD